MITTSVAEAAQILQQGKVLAYPTEAVWGLGCDPFNEQAFLEILDLNNALLKKGSFYWQVSFHKLSIY
jgi:L-threonylcarbamoyladenylate synthase